MPPLRRRFLGVLLVALTPLSGAAQERTPPAALLVDSSDGTATLQLRGLLENPELLDALHSGLPLRIRVQSELWRDRFFDSQEGSAEWRASVSFEPMENRYRVSASGRPSFDLRVTTLLEARAALAQDLPVTLRPQEPGRYYYLASLVVETLSLSDLEELQRWLRGELAPAVRDETDVEGALGRGLKRFFVRALRLPALRAQTRSEAFDYRPPER